ncbi:MAG: hypothetical protein INR64_06825 [Caulobacteraceae bacterium]|nr:hypothetical protein [Caulobacter sp.]
MAQLIRALALAALAGAVSPAAAACLRYEPAQVVLVGRLTVPADRSRLVLRLDRPICVTAGSGAPAAENVRTVHFNFDMIRIAPTVEGWQGRRAAVSGSLFRGPHDHDGELSLLVTGLGRAR